MLNPTVNCYIVKSSGLDIYGNPLPGLKTKTRCAIVNFLRHSEKTSVRADSSASRGRAHEVVFDAVLLFPKTAKIEIDDVVEIIGYKLKAKSVYPRHDVNGAFDHIEVGLNVWA